MKLNWDHLEQFRRLKEPMASSNGEKFGAFFVPYGKDFLVIIASEGDEITTWEHVSLRAETHKGSRIPTWEEMCFAKDLFWDEEETVVQFHPAKSEYVNMHHYVLHLWRPKHIEIAKPPKILVGV